MKPTKCPAREKKTRQEKRKKREGEKVKSKSQDCCVTFKPKNYLKILLSAHMSNTLNWIPADKTWSPMETGRRKKLEVQLSPLELPEV